MYKATGEFKVRRMDGQEYLVPIGGKWSESADLMELNNVSSFIWKQLPNDLDTIVDKVVSVFTVDRPTAQDDAKEYLDELINLGLVVHE